MCGNRHSARSRPTGRLPSLGRLAVAVAVDFFPLVALAISPPLFPPSQTLPYSVYEFDFILLVPALAIETLLAVVIAVRMIERDPVSATITRSIELTAGIAGRSFCFFSFRIAL